MACQAIPYRRPVRVEAAVRAVVVAWAVQEQRSGALQQVLAGLGGEAPRVVSSWQMTQLSLETLRCQVRGQWDERRLWACRLWACLPALQRYLTSRPRVKRSGRSKNGPCGSGSDNASWSQPRCWC